jgi:hypothetical protein
MHDAGGMRAAQRRGDLLPEIEHGVQLEPARRVQQLPQRPAFDELHRDVLALADRPHVVHGDDAGMIQRRSRARLLDEAPPRLGIAVHQHLDRDRAAELASRAR